VWARQNSSTNSSLLVDGPWRSDSCGQYGGGMGVSVLGMLKQVVNSSELIPDEVQWAFENSKGGWWSQALAP